MHLAFFHVATGNVSEHLSSHIFYISEGFYRGYVNVLPFWAV